MTGPYEYVPSGVLAGRHASGWRVRLQHGNKSGAGNSDAGIVGEIHSQGSSSGRSMTFGIITRAESALTTVNVFSDGFKTGATGKRPRWMITSAKHKQ